MSDDPMSGEPRQVIAQLLQRRLSGLSTAVLLAIPFQGRLFARARANWIEDLRHEDFLVFLHTHTSAVQIASLEQQHRAKYVCSASFCLTQAGKLFRSDVECPVAEHPDLVRLFTLDRAGLIAHISEYWAPVVLDVLDIT